MSATATTAVVQKRVQPLIDALRPAHGDGLRSVIAYGPEMHYSVLPRGVAQRVLAVLELATAERLLATAPQVGQLRRVCLEPLFMGADEMPGSCDVYPLELLEMRADYQVCWGDDVLAGLTFERGAVRAQTEEDLRTALHWLRQEVARGGHRPRPTRLVLARSFCGLQRAWRGLLYLDGGSQPADPDALLNAATAALGLDEALLARLRLIEVGAQRPRAEELPDLVMAYDRLLADLVERVDRMAT